MTTHPWIPSAVCFLALTGGATAAIADIIPDASLGVEGSVLNRGVNQNGRRIDRIDGGAQRGRFLFHSFRDFNVGDRQQVYFANPANIQTIVSRVTGDNASTILGTLGVLGDANLFLMNPNGLIFGPNAQLDLRGSFIGTTADRLWFGPDLSFDAAQPDTPPLLTVEVPTGLQFGSDPAAIVNLGTLEVDQDMILAGGTVVSPGSLVAPQGTVAIATPSPSSQTLSHAGQPITLMPLPEGHFGQSHVPPYLITPAGLIPIPAAEPGDIVAQGVTAQSAILAAGQTLDLSQSQLLTQGNLTLQGQTVVLEDRLGGPVTAIAGGDLFIQGRDRIHIQALSDPQSILAAGGPSPSSLPRRCWGMGDSLLGGCCGSSAWMDPWAPWKARMIQS
jgi:filamentous hemagglutinin family protein